MGCCRVLSGACLTVEGLCSCRVLSDAVGAVGAVRLLLLSDIGCCCQVLSGGAVGRRCQALTHTSHTYDTIKRRHQQDSELEYNTLARSTVYTLLSASGS